jgi:hypothetical protein
LPKAHMTPARSKPCWKSPNVMTNWQSMPKVRRRVIDPKAMHKADCIPPLVEPERIGERLTNVTQPDPLVQHLPRDQPRHHRADNDQLIGTLFSSPLGLLAAK